MYESVKVTYKRNANEVNAIYYIGLESGHPVRT